MILTCPIGSQPQTSGDIKLTLIVVRQADMFIGIQIALHEKFGLKSDVLRQQFFDFLRSANHIPDQNPLSRWADLLRQDANIIRSLNACQNQPQCSIPFTVYEWFLKVLREFGVDFVISPTGDVLIRGINPKSDVAQWTYTDKFIEVIKRAAMLLPADVGEELLALIDPWVVGIAVAVVVVWAISHFFGVGEIADVILIIVGVVSLGPIAWKAGEHLINFALKMVGGKTSEDLDEAAKHLSEAVSLIGVQVAMALLLKKAPKAFREPRNKMGTKLSTPYSMKTIGEPPITEGYLFYKPKTTILESPFPAGKSAGFTNQWGDITLLVSKVASEAQAAKIHELVHRFLVPKLQAFPQLRQSMAVLKSNSYLKSYILRYLEEALAETVAKLSVNGVSWQNFLLGLKFPLGNNGSVAYVTKAAIKSEAAGILLGPINVTGMWFNVYYAFQ
jgi:hypothetical protein